MLTGLVSKKQNRAESRIPNPESRIPNPESRILKKQKGLMLSHQPLSLFSKRSVLVSRL
ncbi:hypothetical protein THF1D04_130014 [Vibrio owensii]|uniref:Uncharacterized protein n=1 Tax=Vibrio owensii TaxID=696485 RepID=A0AAU9Q138_9VIBR|nr:hypothetical protein THF1D04_130014 [Vibrio owensii]